MTSIEISGRDVMLDDEGYLVNFDDWNDKVACALAEREGIDELKKEKMDILIFIRDYYRKFNFFPILHSVCKNVHLPKECVREEFINPITAWKLAGLPKPDENMISIIQYGQTPG